MQTLQTRVLSILLNSKFNNIRDIKILHILSKTSIFYDQLLLNVSFWSDHWDSLKTYATQVQDQLQNLNFFQKLQIENVSYIKKKKSMQLHFFSLFFLVVIFTCKCIEIPSVQFVYNFFSKNIWLSRKHITKEYR